MKKVPSIKYKGKKDTIPSPSPDSLHKEGARPNEGPKELQQQRARDISSRTTQPHFLGNLRDRSKGVETGLYETIHGNII